MLIIEHIHQSRDYIPWFHLATTYLALKKPLTNRTFFQCNTTNPKFYHSIFITELNILLILKNLHIMI